LGWTVYYSFSMEKTPATQMSWFWAMLMGSGMLGGGILALIIAATRVVLPYDEQFVGMTRHQLIEVNPRLLAFMAHDRVSLAGTMIGVGVFYVQLSIFGIRFGYAWARQAVLISAFAGFASFFLFLGFGYFDPFHAFVTAILFPFLLLTLFGSLGLQDTNDRTSAKQPLLAKLGQWLLVAHGVALCLAGIIISFVGCTSVFVPEDLHFMHTTSEAITSANPRLLALVAHDRATFGGMLISSGIAMAWSAWRGYAPGRPWLWVMYLAAGLPAYICAIGVHIVVGYHDWWHLTPAIAGGSIWGLGVVLSYRYLCERS
jgi:dihydroorotate dehydrogenase